MVYQWNSIWHYQKQHLNKYVSVEWPISTHADQARPMSTRRTIFHERRISSVTFAVDLPTVNVTSRWLADSSNFGFMGEQSSPKWEIPYPGRHWTTLQITNTQFDADSFILGEVIHNRTNTQNCNKKQTVNDISTPCLWECVNNI